MGSTIRPAGVSICLIIERLLNQLLEPSLAFTLLLDYLLHLYMRVIRLYNENVRKLDTIIKKFGQDSSTTLS